MDSEFLGMEESLNMYPETVKASDTYTTKILKSVEGFKRIETPYYEEVKHLSTVPANPDAVRESLLVFTKAENEYNVYTIADGVQKQVGSLVLMDLDEVSTAPLSNGLTIALVDGLLCAIDPTRETQDTLERIELPDSFTKDGEKINPTDVAQLNFRVVLNDKGTDYIYWSEINRPSSSSDNTAFGQTLTRYAYTKTDGSQVTFDDNIYYPPAEGTYVGTVETEEVFNSSLNSMRMDFKADTVTALKATDTCLFVFGENSMQVLQWQNSTIAPFAIVSKTSSVGLDIPKTAVVIDRECLFLGKGVGGMLGVWAVGESGEVRKLSGESEDQRFANYSELDALAFNYSYKGHTFYVLTLKGRDLEGKRREETLVLDLGENVWSDRASFNEEGQRKAWNAEQSVMYRGKPVFVLKTLEAANRYILGEFDRKSNMDLFSSVASRYIQRERTTGIKYDGINDIVVTGLELILNNGTTEDTIASDPAYNPQVMLQVSIDGGRTWSNELWASAGKIGQYSWRTRWNGLGRGARFAFRVKMTDPVPFEIATAYLSYLPCGNRV